MKEAIALLQAVTTRWPPPVSDHGHPTRHSLMMEGDLLLLCVQLPGRWMDFKLDAADFVRDPNDLVSDVAAIIEAKSGPLPPRGFSGGCEGCE